MPSWNSYSFKNSPDDTDTLMIKDNVSTGYPNKQVYFSKLWDYIMSKTYAFTQGTKSIPAAINELHDSKTDISVSGTALIINTNGSEVSS